MAYTNINSEDRLVQATFAEHLEKVLDWCERLRKTDRIWRRQKSGHGFCRLGAGSRAGAARRSESLTRRRGDTLNHGCRRGIFALTAMLTSFFRRHPVSDLHRR